MKPLLLIFINLLAFVTYAQTSFTIEFRDAETNNRIFDEVVITNLNTNQLETCSNGLFKATNFNKKETLIISSKNYLTDTLTSLKVRKKDILTFYLYPSETFMQTRWKIEYESLKQTIKTDTIYLANLTDFLKLLSRELSLSKVAAKDSNGQEQRFFIRFAISTEGEIKSFDIFGANYNSVKRSCLRSLLNLPLLILNDHKAIEETKFMFPVKIRMR